MGDLGPVFTRIDILHLYPLKCCENWCFSPRPFFVKTHYFRVQTSRISYPHLWTIKLWKNFEKILQNKKVINGRPRTSFHSNRHFESSLNRPNRHGNSIQWYLFGAEREKFPVVHCYHICMCPWLKRNLKRTPSLCFWYFWCWERTFLFMHNYQTCLSD